jgi:hypothetical protein
MTSYYGLTFPLLQSHTYLRSQIPRYALNDDGLGWNDKLGMRWENIGNGLLLQEQDSSVNLENDKFLWATAPTITVTYPYLRSQIPRCALNDDGLGWNDKLGMRFKL